MEHLINKLTSIETYYAAIIYAVIVFIYGGCYYIWRTPKVAKWRTLRAIKKDHPSKGT